MMSKISIIIPCRNEEKFISNTLKSIIESDYSLDYLEILIVDGRSDDKTREIVKDFEKRYKQIKLIDNPEQTVPYAMNYGIKESKGDIIVRLDAHSVYPSNYISKLVYKAYECESEEEARELVKTLPEKGKWPVYFFNSDTIGEKDFEEFYTGGEVIDLDRFENIGVIKNEPIFDGEKLDYFIWKIERLKEKGWNKKELVDLFNFMIPNFNHKETGKYLNQRM
jgi:glycosyltransferase involved in cell wall biosynthesis